MKSKLLLGVTMLVAVCAAFGFAQQEKVKLEYKRKKGDKLTRTSVSSTPFLMQISAPGFNQTSDGSVETNGELTEEATEVSEGFIAIRRTGKETSKMMGGPAPGEESREFQPTTFRFTTAGKLISADVDAFSSKKSGFEAIGDVLNYLLDQIPFLDEFPDRELSVGDEWTTTRTLKNPDSSEVKVTTKHRLFGLESANKRAWIVSEAKIPFDVNGGPGLAGLKMTGTSELRSHTLFSYDEGKFVKSNETINLNMTIEGMMDGVTITVKMIAHGSGTTTAQQ